jgi:mRNA interferase RelE/StbE
MKILFRKRFGKDLKKIKDQALRERIRQAIEAVEVAEQLHDIAGLKKLSGWDDCFRLRVGEYRLGVTVAGDEVAFVRCLHRRDLYRYFP